MDDFDDVDDGEAKPDAVDDNDGRRDDVMSLLEDCVREDDTLRVSVPEDDGDRESWDGERSAVCDDDFDDDDDALIVFDGAADLLSRDLEGDLRRVRISGIAKKVGGAGGGGGEL